METNQMQSSSGAGLDFHKISTSISFTIVIWQTDRGYVMRVVYESFFSKPIGQTIQGKLMVVSGAETQCPPLHTWKRDHPLPMWTRQEGETGDIRCVDKMSVSDKRRCGAQAEEKYDSGTLPSNHTIAGSEQPICFQRARPSPCGIPATGCRAAWSGLSSWQL